MNISAVPTHPSPVNSIFKAASTGHHGKPGID